MKNLTIILKVREKEFLYCGLVLKILTNTEFLYCGPVLKILKILKSCTVALYWTCWKIWNPVLWTCTQDTEKYWTPVLWTCTEDTEKHWNPVPFSYHSGTELAMNNLTIRKKVREGKILYCGPVLKILKNTDILYHSVTILVLNWLWETSLKMQKSESIFLSPIGPGLPFWYHFCTILVLAW